MAHIHAWERRVFWLLDLQKNIRLSSSTTFDSTQPYFAVMNDIRFFNVQSFAIRLVPGFKIWSRIVQWLAERQCIGWLPSLADSATVCVFMGILGTLDQPYWGALYSLIQGCLLLFTCFWCPKLPWKSPSALGTHVPTAIFFDVTTWEMSGVMVRWRPKCKEFLSPLSSLTFFPSPSSRPPIQDQWLLRFIPFVPWPLYTFPLKKKKGRQSCQIFSRKGF